MSASISPTFRPPRARATARFTATVDLPTPPLPEATATTLRHEGHGLGLGHGLVSVQAGLGLGRKAGGGLGGRRRGRAAGLDLEAAGRPAVGGEHHLGAAHLSDREQRRLGRLAHGRVAFHLGGRRLQHEARPAGTDRQALDQAGGDQALAARRVAHGLQRPRAPRPDRGAEGRRRRAARGGSTLGRLGAWLAQGTRPLHIPVARRYCKAARSAAAVRRTSGDVPCPGTTPASPPRSLDLGTRRMSMGAPTTAPRPPMNAARAGRVQTPSPPAATIPPRPGRRTNRRPGSGRPAGLRRVRSPPTRKSRRLRLSGGLTWTP